MLNKYKHLLNIKTKNLLVDTGPLALLLVGLYKSEKLKEFQIDSKRFDEEDLNLLVNFLRGINLFITPQILAETNNIIGKFMVKEQFKELLKNNMLFLKDRLVEVYIHKNEILNNDLVLKLGITDMSIFLSARDKAVLTIDWRLKNICNENSIQAYHLEEITSFKWIMD